MKTIAAICRALGELLHAAIPIQKAFELAAEKTNDSVARQALLTIAQAVQQGNDVTSSLREQKHRFPTFMIEMVIVAEKTGSLPEILKELAEHYDNLLQLRRTFIGLLIWPVLQFVAAVFVIAFLIFVLGWIAASRGGKPIDILGLGLTGTSGAIIWLCMVFGSFLSLFTLYQIIVRGFQGKRSLDRFFLRIPIVGHCMRSFAIARFSWAFYLTQQTGMPLHHSLRFSLQATNNGAFQAATATICRVVKNGETLTKAFTESKLFPVDYLQTVDVAETSGTVPEALNRLSPQFRDQARRSLVAMSMALSVMVWGSVAIFIVFLIFRIIFWYLGMINDAINWTQ